MQSEKNQMTFHIQQKTMVNQVINDLIGKIPFNSQFETSTASEAKKTINQSKISMPLL